MKNGKKLVVLVLTSVMLLGSTITVRADEPMVCNAWCHPGAADPVIERGLHEHIGAQYLHPFETMQCAACGTRRIVCWP